MSDPNAFFTVDSLATLGGATLIVLTVCNGLQVAFDMNPRWLALLLAEIICIGTVALSGSSDPIHFVVAFANGFLVYSSVIGANTITAHQDHAGRAKGVASKRSFRTRWI